MGFRARGLVVERQKRVVVCLRYSTSSGSRNTKRTSEWGIGNPSRNRLLILLELGIVTGYCSGAEVGITR